MKRFLALLLCLVTVFALFTVSASAAYSTTSNRGDDLVYPNARDYYAAPWAAQILAFQENGAIYIMPMPEPGHGNLGTVRTETWVLVLAEKNGFSPDVKAYKAEKNSPIRVVFNVFKDEDLAIYRAILGGKEQ